jgi:hypothetical protein
VPSGRHVRELNNRRVQFHDFVQGSNGGLLDIGIHRSKELPAMIVSVVGYVKNCCSVEQDWPQSKHGAIARLVESPII